MVGTEGLLSGWGRETFGRPGGKVRRPCHNTGRPGGKVRRPCHNTGHGFGGSPDPAVVRTEGLLSGWGRRPSVGRVARSGDRATTRVGRVARSGDRATTRVGRVRVRRGSPDPAVVRTAGLPSPGDRRPSVGRATLPQPVFGVIAGGIARRARPSHPLARSARGSGSVDHRQPLGLGRRNRCRGTWAAR